MTLPAFAMSLILLGPHPADDDLRPVRKALAEFNRLVREDAPAEVQERRYRELRKTLTPPIVRRILEASQDPDERWRALWFFGRPDEGSLSVDYLASLAASDPVPRVRSGSMYVLWAAVARGDFKDRPEVALKAAERVARMQRPSDFARDTIILLRKHAPDDLLIRILSGISNPGDLERIAQELVSRKSAKGLKAIRSRAKELRDAARALEGGLTRRK